MTTQLGALVVQLLSPVAEVVQAGVGEAKSIFWLSA